MLKVDIATGPPSGMMAWPDNDRLFQSLVLWLNELFPKITLTFGFPHVRKGNKYCYTGAFKMRKESITIIVDGVNFAFFSRVVVPVLSRDYSDLRLLCQRACETDIVLLNTRKITVVKRTLRAISDLVEWADATGIDIVFTDYPLLVVVDASS